MMPLVLLLVLSCSAVTANAHAQNTSHVPQCAATDSKLEEEEEEVADIRMELLQKRQKLQMPEKKLAVGTCDFSVTVTFSESWASPQTQTFTGLPADTTFSTSLKTGVTTTCDQHGTDSWVLTSSTGEEKGIEYCENTQVASSVATESNCYTEVGVGYCDWHYKYGGQIDAAACSALCGADTHCHVFTVGDTLGCRYSTCGSYPGPDPCPEDKQCPIATTHSPSTMYELSGMWVEE